MPRISLKMILALFFCGVFVYVIFYVPYPESLTQASMFQILAFFIPLFLALAYLFNIFLNFFIGSCILSTGLILLLILKSLDALNLVTGGLTLLAVYLFLSYFQKGKKKRLTYATKIPKLHSI